MTIYNEVLSADVVRALGWTLAHFIWEGAIVAALLYVSIAFCRRSVVRYALAVSTLVLMCAAPVATFILLRQGSDLMTLQTTVGRNLPSFNSITNLAVTSSAPAGSSSLPFDWAGFLVFAWFLGVVVFGLRAFGGWMMLRRFYKETGEAILPPLADRFAALERRLGIKRRVRYMRSRRVDSPAVIGWFRPIVLLPAATLAGLTAEQLEAVLAHELAHILRLDCFVNLFQIVVESVLFYHPAVWWVSRTIRAERENCCDDVAVFTCGDPAIYARALTLVESSRAVPAFAMGANGAPLRLRIERLLGLKTVTNHVSSPAIVVLGLLCTAGALLAGTTFKQAFPSVSTSVGSSPVLTARAGEPQSSAAPAPSPSPTVATPAPAAAPSVRPVPAPSVESAELSGVSVHVTSAVNAAVSSALAAVAAADDENESAANKSSYLDGMRDVGLKDLTVDQLIALKIQAITPDYVRQVRALGIDASVGDLIGMKVQGVMPEYLQGVRKIFPDVKIGEIIAMKIQGVTPEYVETVRNTFPDARAGDIIGMKIQGVTPAYIAEVRKSYPNAHIGEIIGMKIQGVSPTDAAEYQRVGLHDLRLGQLIAFRIQGVTPAYVQMLQSAGLTNLTPGDVISAKVQGISSDFVQKVRSHGFSNVNLHQLLGLKMAGVF
jgi:beta-lactamase regulating signal transducer with metallopeptidase domain